MAGQQGTHVHTADNAVPPLNDDLAGLLEDLRGFHPGIDQICDGVRLLALDRLSIPQTQTALTVLAGSTDEPGQQIDVAALIGALIARLLNSAENPALRTLPAHVQAAAAEAGRAFADHDADFTPRTDLAKTVYTLNPL